jgi:hypothetical protein
MKKVPAVQYQVGANGGGKSPKFWLLMPRTRRRETKGSLEDRCNLRFWDHLSVSFDELLFNATFLEHVVGRAWHVCAITVMEARGIGTIDRGEEEGEIVNEITHDSCGPALLQILQSWSSFKVQPRFVDEQVSQPDATGYPKADRDIMHAELE